MKKTIITLTFLSISLSSCFFKDSFMNINVSPKDETPIVSNAISCPTNYVPVPADAAYGVEEFCVMKYEAKAWHDSNANQIVDTGEVDVDGCQEVGCTTANWQVATHTPISQPDALPWRRIGQANAWDRCDSLNTETVRADIDNDINQDGTYALLSNPEWMSIARNMELQPANWSSGQVGNGCLFRGNNGINDSCGYNIGAPVGGTSRNAKSKLVLSNGSEIWDMAGNVFEWVDWTYEGPLTPGPTTCTPTSWVEFTAVNCVDIQDDEVFSAFNYDSTKGMGRFYGGVGGAAKRDGHWYDGVSTGIFALGLDFQDFGTSDASGFRCRYR